MKVKKKSGGGGANWMDTYGDMVTLLLCFFVLLYSISTMDENKWKALVQSFNPNAIPAQTETDGNKGSVADAENEGGNNMLPASDESITQEDVDVAIEELYKALKEYVENTEGAAQSVEVTKGDGYVFVSFNDAVFFDGYSYTLRDDSTPILDMVSEALTRAAPYIDEVRIMGHTSQETPERKNTPETDRMLAAQRSAAVAIYIQTHTDDDVLDPARILTVGYGQWRPVAGFDTAENRAKNRRVEMMVSGKDVASQLGDQIQQYYTIREGDASADSGTGNSADSASSAAADGGGE